MSALPLRAARAHEIKNHLSVTFAFARLLEEDVPPQVITSRAAELTVVSEPACGTSIGIHRPGAP